MSRLLKHEIKIGCQLSQAHGDMQRLRAAWIEADQLGADRIYTYDHFFAQVLHKDVATKNADPIPDFNAKCFESTVIEAAMAATTKRAEIGCFVHGNSYRNPNLVADIARTIDHISGGRYVLGMGAGYFEADYREYGFEFGTAKGRMLEFKRDVPVIKARLQKLNPPPVRPIPLLLAASGETIGLRIVAEHADIWHQIGQLDKLAHRIEVLKKHCAEIGRDFNEIELCTSYVPYLMESDPDAYLALGITHLVPTIMGPDWDLGLLRELLQWRANYQRKAGATQAVRS